MVALKQRLLRLAPQSCCCPVCPPELAPQLRPAAGLLLLWRLLCCPSLRLVWQLKLKGGVIGALT